MNVIKDFGNRFVRVDEVIASNEGIIAALDQYRGIQLPSGLIILSAEDGTTAMVIENADLTKYLIHSIGGPLEWTFVRLCPHANDEQKDKAMIFVTDFVVNLEDKVAKVTSLLK